MLPQLLIINLLFGTLAFLCAKTSFIQDDVAIVGLFTFGFAYGKLTVGGGILNFSAATSIGSCE